MTSDFLAATPSFLSGMARVLDMFGVFDKYNRSTTPELVDSRAIYGDWQMVGKDLSAAIALFEADVETGQTRQLPLFDMPSASA